MTSPSRISAVVPAMCTSGRPMSSTIDVSTLLQNWTVWIADSRSWAALKVEVTSENFLVTWPLSASNGVLIRFARVARRGWQLLLSSFGAGPKSGGDTLDRAEVLMAQVELLVRVNR